MYAVLWIDCYPVLIHISKTRVMSRNIESKLTTFKTFNIYINNWSIRSHFSARIISQTRLITCLTHIITEKNMTEYSQMWVCVHAFTYIQTNILGVWMCLYVCARACVQRYCGNLLEDSNNLLPHKSWGVIYTHISSFSTVNLTSSTGSHSMTDSRFYHYNEEESFFIS